MKKTETNYIEDKIFEKPDFSKEELLKGEYENCTFINCDLSGKDLSAINFSDCVFDNCNISMAKLEGTGLKNCSFKKCKLLGLRFDTCSDFLFEVSFDNCILDLSSFYKRKLKKTTFNNTSIKEVDFSSADLSNAVFDHCDMLGALFDDTILERTDFRLAYNYSINPETNRIKKAKFSVNGLSGLLHKYDIDIE